MYMLFNRFSYSLLCGLALYGYCITAIAKEVEPQFASYTVQIDSLLSDMKITACFPVNSPDYLYSNSNRAGRYIKDIHIDNKPINGLNWRRNRINLRNLSPDECLTYGVNLKAANRERYYSKINYRINGNIVIAASSWLWLPKQTEYPETIDITIIYPQEFAVSAPWSVLQNSPGKTVYRLGNTPFHWSVLTAFGRMTTETIKVPGAQLRLAILSAENETDNKMVRMWIEQGVEAVTKLYGRFPLPATQVMVVPIGKYSEPVPWGEVLRGGNAAVFLYIDQSRTLSEFVNDWTLTHEFSHLIHPNMGREGAWLAEGLATYYQNVLQARSGTLSIEAAWQKLHEGFQRGIAQTRKGSTLESMSRDMKRNRAYMRVYWSGTAIALLADLKLREQGKSLDAALSAFQFCCLPSSKLWSTHAMLTKLDNLTNTVIFTDLYEQYVHTDVFPDLSRAYQQLGIINNGGELVFDQTARYKDLRKAIMSP